MQPTLRASHSRQLHAPRFYTAAFRLDSTPRQTEHKPNRTSYTHAVVSKQTLMTLGQQQPCRSYVTREPLYADQPHTVCVQAPANLALATTSKRQSVVAFFILFCSLTKVTFVSCASAQMATPYSGYTLQLRWKTKRNAHAPRLCNRFPHHYRTQRLGACIPLWMESDAAYKVAQYTLFMVAYLFNESLHYFVANDNGDPLKYVH